MAIIRVTYRGYGRDFRGCHFVPRRDDGYYSSRNRVEPSRVEDIFHHSINSSFPFVFFCALFHAKIIPNDEFYDIRSRRIPRNTISLAISPVRPRLPSPNRRAPLTRLHRADTDSLCRRRSFGHNTTSIHGGIHLGRGIQPQEATLNGFPDAPFTNSIVRNRCLQ